MRISKAVVAEQHLTFAVSLDDLKGLLPLYVFQRSAAKGK
jgi:hypothetical protein